MFCIFYVFCIFCAFCVFCALCVVQSLMRPAKRCGVVGEAAEFNLWHRISRRAREPAVRYIHTTHTATFIPHCPHTLCPHHMHTTRLATHISQRGWERVTFLQTYGHTTRIHSSFKGCSQLILCLTWNLAVGSSTIPHPTFEIE